MYRKLRARIMELFGTQGDFADAMDMGRITLNTKLNGKSDWTASEIVKACELLEIELSEAWLYFFNEEI